ncbi:MAG TPA: PstS family phosphate ABC transporter substrate-binding protein [Acidimicrobiales bacterium]|nr:PstS family phosphate ABC transporter substrate-binding protein [Acidimicrobiales bacterium]
MTKSKTRWWRLIAGLLGLTLIAGACGGGDDTGAGAGGEGGDLSGSIAIDGSSTVAPLSEAIAEEFRAEASNVNVSVGTSGTGGGFKKFCADEIEIADASRPIKQEEIDDCKAKGVEFTEFRVGLDGLAVVTSAKNKFLECLSFAQLQAIWKDGGASTWNQVDPKFPNAKVAIFAPGADSGTYDFFNEEILGDLKKPETPKPRADYTASENDNAIVQGIEGEENSWGYFGYAYYQENKQGLKDVKVSEEEGGECVEPTAETIESGDYPLSRPLFIYVNNKALDRPEVKEFVRFYLETTPELIEEIGYVAAPAKDYEDGLAKLDA